MLLSLILRLVVCSNAKHERERERHTQRKACVAGAMTGTSSAAASLTCLTGGGVFQAGCSRSHNELVSISHAGWWEKHVLGAIKTHKEKNT